MGILNKKEEKNPEVQDEKTTLSKEGIDRIKFALGFVINYSESIIKKMDDKKLSWTERLSLIMELTPLMEVLKNWRELKVQIKDLDTTELEQLQLFAIKEFDIPNEKAEKIVEKCLNILVNIFELIELF